MTPQGFEPWTHTLKVYCSTNWATKSNINVVGLNYLGLVFSLTNRSCTDTAIKSAHLLVAIEESNLGGGLPNTTHEIVSVPTSQYSYPVRGRTWTLLNQNQTCCQLHHGTIKHIQNLLRLLIMCWVSIGSLGLTGLIRFFKELTFDRMEYFNTIF